jgi:hypothetical protein
MTSKRNDAASIVGDDLAEELEKRQRRAGLRTRTGGDASGALVVKSDPSGRPLTFRGWAPDGSRRSIKKTSGGRSAAVIPDTNGQGVHLALFDALAQRSYCPRGREPLALFPNPQEAQAVAERWLAGDDAGFEDISPRSRAGGERGGIVKRTLPLGRDQAMTLLVRKLAAGDETGKTVRLVPRSLSATGLIRRSLRDGVPVVRVRNQGEYVYAERAQPNSQNALGQHRFASSPRSLARAWAGLPDAPPSPEGPFGPKITARSAAERSVGMESPMGQGPLSVLPTSGAVIDPLTGQTFTSMEAYQHHAAAVYRAHDGRVPLPYVTGKPGQPITRG